MLSYPDRFRFKSAPPRASRVMFVWFVFLLLVALLSVGMLITAIVHAEEKQRAGSRENKTQLNPSFFPSTRHGIPAGSRKNFAIEPLEHDAHKDGEGRIRT